MKPQALMYLAQKSAALIPGLKLSGPHFAQVSPLAGGGPSPLDIDDITSGLAEASPLFDGLPSVPPPVPALAIIPVPPVAPPVPVVPPDGPFAPAPAPPPVPALSSPP